MPKARTKSNKDETDTLKKSKATKKTTTNTTTEESKENLDLKNEHLSVPAAVSSSHEMALESSSDVLKQDLLDQNDELNVEIKYDEPVLTSIVVEK